MKTILCFLFFYHLAYIWANEDEIKELSGLDFKINFKHYSGYLKVNETKFLHYWFVESQNNPVKDPLIFWYNGGPGCSSILGLLAEHGPYFPKPCGILRKNPDSWNTNASVVYIESPVGVGYSYGKNSDDYIADDDYAAQLNYDSIKEFFTLYPEFRNHETFITGESYGGVYVPTLTVKILNGMDDFKINLKGIAVGNGLVSDSLLRDTNPLFAYSHGLYDDEEYANLTQECCNGRSDNCKFENSESCLEQADGITEYLLETFYNYDLYMQCYSEGYTNTMAHMLKKKYFDENIKLVHRQQGKTRYIAKNCNLELPLSIYMNKQETRKSLHIPPELPRWNMCNFTLHGQWGDFFDRETAPYYKKIVKSGVRVLLYYGDTDVICQFLSGQKFANTLGLKKLSTKSSWVVDQKIAGFKTEYEGLTFTTIFGTGHMAPEWRPKQVHYMINKFLKNEPF